MTVESLNKYRKHETLNKDIPQPTHRYLQKVEENEKAKIKLAGNTELRELLFPSKARVKPNSEPKKFSYYKQQNLKKLGKRANNNDDDDELFDIQPKTKKPKTARKKLQIVESDNEGKEIEKLLSPSGHQEGYAKKAGKISPGLKMKRASQTSRQNELSLAIQRLSKVEEEDDKEELIALLMSDED